MKLIVISNSSAVENEVQIITALFELGLETFHLRKHKFSTKQIKKLLNEIPSHFHNRIVLHSHHKLARTYDLKGIHMTKLHKRRKLRTWYVTRTVQIRKPKILITTSYSNMGQLLDTNKQICNYDYVFLSPIFDSLSSKFQSGFTEFSLKSAMGKTNLLVIARGGVDVNAVEKANAIGFHGIALYSCLWKRKDPIVEFNKIVEKFQELKIPIE